jgi:hypothetical protein
MNKLEIWLVAAVFYAILVVVADGNCIRKAKRAFTAVICFSIDMIIGAVRKM